MHRGKIILTSHIEQWALNWLLLLREEILELCWKYLSK